MLLNRNYLIFKKIVDLLCILRTTIEKAGLIGSARLSDRFPVINRGVNENRVISYKNHIMVLRGTDSEVKKFNIIPKSDSNVIVVRSMSSISNRLLKLKKDHLVVEHNPKFQEGDDIIISDHLHAVLAHVRAISLKE